MPYVCPYGAGQCGDHNWTRSCPVVEAAYGAALREAKANAARDAIGSTIVEDRL